MPELIGSFFILKVITLLSLRRDAWRGVLQALRGCVISLDNGSRGRAESPKAPSPGHRPG